MALVGIKGTVDDAIKKDISNMILKYFQLISFEEIELAFEMERYGKFTERTEHFQEFNSTYVSKVLTKYLTWKQKTALELNLSRREEEKEITDEEIQRIDKEYFQSILDDLKAGKSYNDISAELYYHRLPSKLICSNEVIISSEFYKTMLANHRKRVNAKSDNIKDGLLRRKFLNEKKDAEQGIVLLQCKNHITCEFLKFKYLKE